MKTVTVTYHSEAEGLWAESVDVEGYTAAASSLPELRRLVREGLPFFLDQDDLDIQESFQTVPG